MGQIELVLATALMGVMLYIADRGIAFQVALYSAIASGREFTAEQAYRGMNNPFATMPKLLLGAIILAILGVVGRDGISADWEVIALCAMALIYVFVCGSAAVKAFRKTSFGNWMSE